MIRIFNNQITTANETLYRMAVLDALIGRQYSTIYDIGSGDGTSTKPIAELVKAKKVICIDHDKMSLLNANKLGYRTLYTDLNNRINLTSEKADLIILNQVVEHIVKTDNLLSEIARLLKPKGVVIICTPNLASWHNIGSLILGFQPFSSQVSDKYYIGNPLHPMYKTKIQEKQAHLRIFTKKSLIELCETVGLQIVRFKGVGYYPFSGKLAKILSLLDPIHSAYLLGIFTKKLG